MAYEHTATFDQAGPDEAKLRREFGAKLRHYAGKLPFAEDLVAAYYCAFDHATPAAVKASLVGALVYFVMPLDAVADFLPVIGFADDAALLAGVMKLVSVHLRPEHYEAARRALHDGLDQRH